MAEALNSLYKAEVVQQRPAWEGHSEVEDLELAALGLGSLVQHRAPHGYLGDVPSVEFENAF